MLMTNVLTRTKARLRSTNRRPSCRNGDQSVQPSRLIPMLFRRAPCSGQLKVLNLGATNPYTIDYLGQFQANITHADLLQQVGTPYIEASGLTPQRRSTLASTMSQCIAQGAKHPFDLCLMWDTLHYLDAPALRLLSIVVTPLLHRQSNVHGYIAHNHGVELPAYQYHIADADHVGMTRTTNHRGPRHAYTAKDLTLLMPKLPTTRGTLLADGRVEALFRTA